MRGRLNREFTVIKQKHRAGQLRRHNSLQILDFRYWTPDSLSAELGFRITIISEIPDSLSWVSDCKAQDSEFQTKNFPGFQIPQAKVSRILEFGLPYWGDQLLVDNLYTAALAGMSKFQGENFA